MYYGESRKSFKARIKKKLIISCSYNSNSMYINWNSIIALNKLKLSNGSKKFPKSNMNQSLFSIAYTKSFEVKPNSIVTLTPNLTESFSTLPFFLWDTLVLSTSYMTYYAKLSQFFTIASTYDIMRYWQISWFSNFACFF